ncbi:hypothetical protein StoSoilB20_22170 [Arthrobacter sp. StoSoilB20]|nr:hypothetical protein StoSoilB20_22170 [Arthrobacter sp. StoSoilB20]
MTLGLVSARYALNLREIPMLPRAGDALRGVSVVLTAAVTLFYALGFSQRLPSRSSKLTRAHDPLVASKYHTVAGSGPMSPKVVNVSETSPTFRAIVIHIREFLSS